MTITYTQASANPAWINPAYGSGTRTFSSVNGGTPFPSGSKIVVGLAIQGGSTAPSSVTVGGNAMVTASTALFTGRGMEIYYYDAGSSVTDTIAVTLSGDNYLDVRAGYITGAASGAASSYVSNATPYGDNTPVHAAPTIPSGGIAIALLNGPFAGTVVQTSTNWTNATSIGLTSTLATTTYNCLSDAYNNSGSGAVTISASGTPTSVAYVTCLIAAAWAVGSVAVSPVYKRLDTRLRRHHPERRVFNGITFQRTRSGLLVPDRRQANG